MAMTMNFLGLTLALCTFILLIAQVRFDSTFDAYHSDADRIYRVELEWQGKKVAIVSKPMVDFMSQFPIVEANTMMEMGVKNDPVFVDNGKGERAHFVEKVYRVTSSVTDVFHFDMVEGSAQALSQPALVLISETQAKRFFGDESALNRLITVNSSILSVGGVYRDFPLNSSIQNGIYTSISPQQGGEWGQLNYNAYIRIGASVEEIDSTLIELGNALSSEIKDNEPQMPPMTVHFTPLRKLHFVTDVMYDNTPKSNRQTIFILLTIAIAVILISGINYMNFNLALIPMRIKSFNVHKILGATNGSIRRIYILESVVVALLAFLLSLLIVTIVYKLGGLTFLNAASAWWYNPVVILLTFVLALFIGIIAGIYPAYCVVSFPPSLALKGTFSMVMGAKTLKRMLIGLQFLVAYVLVMCSCFMFLQNRFLKDSNKGYNTEQVILIDLNRNIKQSKDVFTDQLKTIVGVMDVSYASVILSSNDSPNAWNMSYKGKNIMFHWIPVDPSFLDVMNIPVVEGRAFTKEDRETSKGKYIFNEKARFEYGITLNELLDSIEVVGFVDDVQYTTFRTTTSPMAFYVSGKSMRQSLDNYAYVKVSAGSNKNDIMRNVQTVVKKFETDVPLNVRFYDDLFDQVY